MPNITQAQKKILEAVQKSTNNHGRPPTLRELCTKTGLKSTWTIRYHLKKLEEAGLLSLKENLSRGITLLRQSTGGIPLVGKISAGKPIEAIENIEDTIDMSYLFSNVDNIFALKIKGDSMINAGIFDGDIVFVKKQATAINGDIVAAIINNEATVKRFVKTSAGVKLTAENPKYEPIISKNIKIAGKVVGIIRKYG
ncbi:MAG: repressor LexA [Candidatus Firestonebacteria bacterium RIFOXYC2_FULL_39_67]|nr:MAG: repressor LexA [Candidatus Firestonebacteria bacterium RIFOXYD2_FULL_39_29]OGF55379.1 MAG: repressor LexA [Candidatus Firestonebacteria bacterium RIFOXYC2_FULL_39_67]OGF56742.1 MAG: repressor LexA [Candidatus Firestonebacteria bacterium RifOxyC12_full_39_7]